METRHVLDYSLEAGQSTLTHYAHPRRLDKTWCGAERDPDPYKWQAGEAECVVCRDLRGTLGAEGWKLGLA